MSLDVAYILGAGMGSRMGSVGEVLPKLLWPVYEKTLLELQVDYAYKCEIKKIYLNTHFQADVISSYIREKNIEIEVIFEETLLDIGGAVHNLARKLDYEGRILILNGDQFLLFSKLEFEEFDLKSFDYTTTLLGLEVPRGSSYNELKIENSLLKGISPPVNDRPFYTYSGVSIVNLSKLKPRKGRSKFFDSVANFKEESVFVYKASELEYWDFGTTDRYCKSMNNIILNKDSAFREFIINNNAFDEKKVLDLRYNTKLGKDFSINLSGKEQGFGFGNIVLSGNDRDLGNDQLVLYDEYISRA